MIKLDIKDAYLSVPLYYQHRKFMAFRWRGHLWRFMSLLFGLSSAPFIFTKLMRPIVATLRKLDIRLILYLDDMLVIAPTKEEVRKYLATALELLIALVFVLDLNGMSISLPNQKLRSLQRAASKLKHQGSGPVRQLAQVLGMMVAAHPAILPAPLHFRYLERARARALRNGLAYKTQLEVSHGMETDLIW